MPTCAICGREIDLDEPYIHGEGYAYCVECAIACAGGDVPGGPDRQETIQWFRQKLQEKRREIECRLTGRTLCEFRAVLAGGDPVEWDCLNCKEHGYPLCNIECSVDCRECIRRRLCAQEGRIQI